MSNNEKFVVLRTWPGGKRMGTLADSRAGAVMRLEEALWIATGGTGPAGKGIDNSGGGPGRGFSPASRDRIAQFLEERTDTLVVHDSEFRISMLVYPLED